MLRSLVGSEMCIRDRSPSHYMVICVIYCHQLPFYLICGGAPHQIQPYFCLISTKNAYKFFSRRSGGAPAPLHPWLRLCSPDRLLFLTNTTLCIVCYIDYREIFTALHCMQCGLSYGKRVCLSVCPSNACSVINLTKVLPTFLYHMKGKCIYFLEHKE